MSRKTFFRSRVDAQQDVERVGQRDRHVGPEGLEALDDAGHVDLVLAGEAGHVHVEHRSRPEDATPPTSRWRSCNPRRQTSRPAGLSRRCANPPAADSFRPGRSSEIPRGQDARHVNRVLRQSQNALVHGALAADGLEPGDLHLRRARITARASWKPSGRESALQPSDWGERGSAISNVEGQLRGGGHHGGGDGGELAMRAPVVQNPLGHGLRHWL